MTASIDVNCSGLEKAFDVLLRQSQRILQENELLRGELLRHPSGKLQIHFVERSLARAYRQLDDTEASVISRPELWKSDT
jgi:hypothetical protein